MRRQQVALVGLMWLLAWGAGACGGGSAPTQPGSGTSTTARDYLEHLVLLMQQNSLKRTTIDWAAFRAAVMAKADGAQTITETHPAIRVALELLADNHSQYVSVSGTSIFVSSFTCAAAALAVPELPANIGYVRVPRFSGSAIEATMFARDRQAEIRAADKDDLAGWIVDLRGNTGGNMWPMIAGVGPVLGEGLAGHFVEPTGFESQWGYRHGASWNNDVEAQHVFNPYRLRRENPRVAVLTDNLSNSAGEATIVAFRQRPNTRSFGTASCGRSTAVRGFPVYDGATLYLATSVMADRSKTMFGAAIVPDEVISDPEETVRRAVAWLTAGR